MELKKYQTRVLREVKTYLEALAREKNEGNLKHAGKDAWDSLDLIGHYEETKTGSKRDLPTFCIKVPTGGGKTLLATQILGQVYKTLLPAKNGTGLVLWVVPSDQIYSDLLKALRDRTHFYRESLEFAMTGRVNIWEKHEVARLTPVELASSLNILVLKLPGTNRLDRESLKFFRDASGQIVNHFPREDEPERHKELYTRIPNLDMWDADSQTGSYLAKTSVANLVRMCEPVVILDEKQKAASQLARDTIAGFNPCIVVELSATPPDKVNVLSKVTGEALLHEDMIKLPINVSSSEQKSWQKCLTQARDKREELAAKAREHSANGNRMIRPIVLVQVERVGEDQRDAHYIHSEDVREYLVQRLGIDSRCVKVKTSVTNEIENIDLLAHDCLVEWIITKSALQEGWDCPFAYILVSLANVKSTMSMTQLVGRVLRQPFVEKTPFHELNESYVYCLYKYAGEVVRQIRNALQNEGYEGHVESLIDQSDGISTKSNNRLVQIRPEFRNNYLGPIPGSIFLPRFCVKLDHGKYEPMDYYCHLLKQVDVSRFDYDKALTWDFAVDLKAARDQFFQVFLSEDDALEPLNVRNEAISYIESDAQTRAWLVANFNMDWYSAKRLRFIVDQVFYRLVGLENRLALIRFSLLEKITGLIMEETDKQTESIFKSLTAAGQIKFFSESRDCVFEIPKQVEKRISRKLRRPDDTELQRPLFEMLSTDEVNGYEEEFAYYLDEDEDVLWWHRNAVGEFGIQGYRRNRIYPDYVVQLGRNGNAEPEYLIVESKGAHLKGNMDTEYKRTVASYFSDVGNQVQWQELVGGFKEHNFFFRILDAGEYPGRAWREEWEKMKHMGYGYEPTIGSVLIVK